jgi:RHS repeat-associated protein
MATYANSATSTSATYSYDAAGQRTKSAVTVSGTTTTTNWAYDDLTLMRLSATQGSSSWRVDYLYDEDGTPYGGVYRSPATSTSPTYFTTITNGRGDVVELLDANGNAFAAYHYDTWGSLQGAGSYATGIWTTSTSLITSTLAGQIASRQVLRYAGYVYDPESGLYYCSARYYDPATRQWTTADSPKADGEESACQYCGGDAVNGVDPTGCDTTKDHDYTWPKKKKVFEHGIKLEINAATYTNPYKSEGNPEIKITDWLEEVHTKNLAANHVTHLKYLMACGGSGNLFDDNGNPQGGMLSQAYDKPTNGTISATTFNKPIDFSLWWGKYYVECGSPSAVGSMPQYQCGALTITYDYNGAAKSHTLSHSFGNCDWKDFWDEVTGG